MSLNKQITQIERLLRRTIPKMIAIRLELAEDLKLTNADPAQIEQIIVNLTVNAKDAMGEAGRLTIRTENVSLDEESCKQDAEAAPGDWVALTVTDTGHGMDRDTMRHIFEPFYTTKELGRGTGLGLAMVYGIVTQHGGYVACRSQPGEGTRFSVYLPAISAESTASAEESSKSLELAGKETVLLVDDEEMIRGLGKRILEKNHYTVLTAVDGKQALEVFLRERERIGLVVMDLIMPVMGGKDCLKQLLELDPDVRVLIASGQAVDASTEECLSLGAKAVLRKPFRAKQLLAEVRKALHEPPKSESV
jgi:CheY-like chemotaxis protein